MEFICEARDLKTKLEIAKLAMPKRHTSLPILERAKAVTVGQKCLRIESTNLEHSIRIDCPGTVLDSGKGFLPVRQTLDFLTGKNEMVMLESGDDGLVVNSTASGFVDETKFDQAEWPPFPDIPLTTDVSFDGAIKRTIPFVSKEETRHFLNGIYIHGNGNLDVVGLDGKRLLQVVRDWPASCEVGMIIPTEAAKILAKMQDPITMGWLCADPPKDEEGNEVELPEDWKPDILIAMFKSEDFTLATRVIEGEYPDYSMVLHPEEDRNNVTMEIERQDLIPVLQELQKVIKKNDNISMTFTGGPVLLSAARNGITLSREFEVLSYEGEDLNMAVNPLFLLDILRNMEAEVLTLRTVDDGMSPIFVDGDDDESAIMMPRRM